MAEGFDREWIFTNQEVIKCRTFAATDAVFSAYMAAIHYEPGGVAWWYFARDAIEASAQLYACQAPSPEVYEEAFGGENKRCQCAEVGGQLFLEWLDAAGNRTKLSNSELVEAKQIKDAAIADGIASCNWLTVAGETRLATYDIQDGSKPIWYIVPTLNTECCAGTPNVPVVQPYPPPQIYAPSEEEGCNITVDFIDSCLDRFGLMQNFYKVTIPRECNPGGGDLIYWYWESVRGPIIYSTASGRSFYGQHADPPYAPPHPHAALPLSAGGASSLSAVTYTLDVGCSYNQETDEFDKKYTYDVEATNDGIFGLARRMDALAWMINNAQLLPYTDCANVKPVLEGQWVTTRWESDKKMDHSGRRLRKLFRYRTKSTRDLGQLSAYWQDFTWGAGDVCVIHKGAWWGTPQVWAKSTEEGQRVIRHAAAEAGLDPDQIGRWEIGSSRAPRYGMSGNMRVLKKDGFPWISSRDNADWPNMLALQRDP